MSDKIAVIGLGKAGLPLAAVIADSGFEVVGVDVDAVKCGMINEGKNPIPEEPGLAELIEAHGGNNFIATPRYDDAAHCTVFIIIVPLFIDENNDPDFCILDSAFRNVGKILKKKDLVVLETSAPLGTTENLVMKLLVEESGLELGDFYLACSPERIMTGVSVSRLKAFPKVVGGVNAESGVKAFKTYERFIPNMHLVSSARVAEFIKLVEGCYRDVNICLANELFKIADELCVDFYEARDYANHEYCHIHLPSTGVGGHCIPVYPWFLIKEMDNRGKPDHARLLRTSRELNDDMVDYWAKRIVLECMGIDKPLWSVKICVHGITFRPGVKELYHSRSLALAKRLVDNGLSVFVHDELYTKEELDEIGFRHIEIEDADVVFDSFELTVSSSG